jgi:hypothetical protein
VNAILQSVLVNVVANKRKNISGFSFYIRIKNGIIKKTKGEIEK